jgi:hypothetical protein
MNDPIEIATVLFACAAGLVVLRTGGPFCDWCERRRVPRIDVTAIGKGAAHPRPQVQTRTFSVPGNEDLT